MPKGLQAQLIYTFWEDHMMPISSKSFNVYGKTGKTYKLIILCDNTSSK
jgi:hypothetical protein